MAEIHAMTERQLRLFYGHALRREAMACAQRVADVNAGMAGGKHARERIKSLTEPS